MKTARRSRPAKDSRREREPVTARRLRNLLWFLFERTVKAFFEALFDHYAE